MKREYKIHAADIIRQRMVAGGNQYNMTYDKLSVDEKEIFDYILKFYKYAFDIFEHGNIKL